jgi:glycosyltransferase involved in cell wall biosynthesis
MNVAFVDPIAATANYTGGNLLRPEVPSLCQDPRILEQTKLVELATEVARLGHRTTVLFGDVFLDGQEFTTSAGVHIAPVQTVMRFPFHPGILPAAPSLLGHEALREADVVQVSEFHQLSTFFSCVTAREASVPVVLWQETYRQMRFPGSVYQRMYESTVGPYVRAQTGRFIPRTTKAHEYLRQLHAAEGRIGPWIPTGIDIDAFAPRRHALSSRDFGWPDGAPILLTVGRLHPTKGIDLALRTLKWVIHRHPDAKLVIRGSGPEKPALLRLAKDLGIEGSARFIGRMSREEMVDLYNLADVVLCPSKVDLLPFSLMEAAACARPSVVTDVGAIRDIVVDGETGIVVRDRTVEALGAAVCSLLEDDERRTALGSRARRRAEETFALPVVAGKLNEVYRDVAS